MRKFIKKDQILRNFDDIDAIYLCTNTQGLTYKKGLPCKEKSYKTRTAQNFPSDIEVDKLRYEISFTTKTADDYRVIAIADTYTKNLNFITRESTSQINDCKWDIYGKPRWDVINYLKWNKNDNFIMVDQEKSGWTFPMELMEDYFEVISSMYPGYRPFEIYHRIFKEKDIQFLIEGQWKNPVRGFVLGMWDNIMSFILSCIFNIFKEEKINDISDLDSSQVTGKFWGDDQVIKVQNSDKQQGYTVMNRWINYMTRFGCIINKKKCFMSNYAVLCEVYSPNGPINLDKGAVWILQPFDSIRGVNTFHRKTLWCSYHSTVKSALTWFRYEYRNALLESSEKSLELTRSLIGYEFSPEETRIQFQ
jgi:hypothetical protein